MTGKIPMIRKNGKVDRVYICQVCGKERIRTNLIKHIKAIIIAIVEQPCNICAKLFPSKHWLRSHKLKH